MTESATESEARTIARELSLMSLTWAATGSRIAPWNTRQRAGLSVLKKLAISVCSGVRVLLVLAPTAFTSLYSLAYSSLVRGGGFLLGWNWLLLWMTKGLTEPSHGAAIPADAGARSLVTGRHFPTAFSPIQAAGIGFGTRPSSARMAMIPTAAFWPTITPGSSSFNPFLARYSL